MKQELFYYLTQAIRAKVVCGLSSLVAFTLLLSVPLVKSDAGKVLLLSSSLATAASAKVMGNTLQESEDALNDYAVTTGLLRQRSLLWLPAQTRAKPTPHTQADKPMEVFDLRQIGSKRDEFPNIFIVGAPGTGKTTAAEYLGVVLKADKRYAVHPHAKPTDFKGFDRMFGGGRNIGTPDDEYLPWVKIADGLAVPTVAQVFKSLHGLMQERYEQYYKGITNFSTIDVYFDEMPAIALTLGQKFLGSILPALIMECRKVGIRLWFLSQAFQIRSFGLEGISDLREGATIIRLGKLALKEAQTLFRNKAVDQTVVDYLKLAERPVLVDDVPAKLPRYTEMQAAINSFVQQKKPTQEKKAKKRQ